MRCVLVSYIELPKHGVGRKERAYMSDTAMAIKFMLPGGQPVHLSWLWMTFTCANGTDNRWIGQRQLARQPPCYWMVLPVVATEHFPPLIEQFLGKFLHFWVGTRWGGAAPPWLAHLQYVRRAKTASSVSQHSVKSVGKVPVSRQAVERQKPSSTTAICSLVQGGTDAAQPWSKSDSNRQYRECRYVKWNVHIVPH